jgi:hypothetical protein
MGVPRPGPDVLPFCLTQVRTLARCARLSGEANHPSGARPSKCISIMVRTLPSARDPLPRVPHPFVDLASGNRKSAVASHVVLHPAISSLYDVGLPSP